MQIFGLWFWVLRYNLNGHDHLNKHMDCGFVLRAAVVLFISFWSISAQLKMIFHPLIYVSVERLSVFPRKRTGQVREQSRVFARACAQADSRHSRSIASRDVKRHFKTAGSANEASPRLLKPKVWLHISH